MNDDPRREVLHAFFRIGSFIAVGGVVLALLNPTDSGEFVISVLSAVLGGLLMLGVAIMVRLSR